MSLTNTGRSKTIVGLKANDACGPGRQPWQLVGISAEEAREFCVWRNAPMRVLSSQGDLVASGEDYPPEARVPRTRESATFSG